MLVEHPEFPDLHPELRFFGYWRSRDRRRTRDTRPIPEDFVDLGWDAEARAAVAAHLREARTLFDHIGGARCRVCGEPIGTRCLTDGTFGFPEGLVHYVELHGLRPPEPLVRHVLDRITSFRGT